MPEQLNIKKAFLQEIVWGTNGQIESEGDKMDVQFNPQTLKVTYANQKAGGDQRGGSAIQYVGQGTTKMSVELLFDATVPYTDGQTADDVRFYTQQVARFIKPDPDSNASTTEEEIKLVPPGIRFQWGSFQFEGVVDGISESLDYFSPEGKPLRATISLDISRQDIIIRPVQRGGAGSTPLAESVAGISLQASVGANWQAVAEANGIENPRQIAAGTLLNVNVGGSVSAGLSASASAGASSSISAGAASTLSTGAASQLGFGASASFGGGIGGGSLGASGAATTGLGAGVSAEAGGIQASVNTTSKTNSTVIR